MSVDDLKECVGAARQQGIEQGVEQMQSVNAASWAARNTTSNWSRPYITYDYTGNTGTSAWGNVRTIPAPGRYRVSVSAWQVHDRNSTPIDVYIENTLIGTVPGETNSGVVTMFADADLTNSLPSLMTRRGNSLPGGIDCIVTATRIG